MAARDASLQKPWAAAALLHLGIVIALERDAVEVAKAIKEVRRHMSEVRRITDAIAETIDHKAM